MKKLSVLLLIVLLGTASYGATLLVPGTYADIPAAVSAANNGDVIQVTSAGNYVNSGAMYINKNVTIEGTVSGVSVINEIDLQGTSIVTAQNITFTGNGYGFQTDTTQVVNANLAILNCSIVNKTGTVWGLEINRFHNSGRTNVTVTNSIISSNFAQVDLYGGVFTFSGCSIIGNQGINNIGIRGIVINGFSTLSVSNHYSYGNTAGVVCQITSGNTIVLSKSSFCNEGQLGVWILQPTNATISNCTINQNKYGNIRVGDDPNNNAIGSNVQLINCMCDSCQTYPGILAMGIQMNISVISTNMDYNDQYGFLYAYSYSNDTPSVFNFTDCTFSNNTLGGFGVADEQTPTGPEYLSAVTAIGCKFDNNKGPGFVTYDMEGNCVAYISQCEFIGNTQNAIYLNTNDTATGYKSVYIERAHMVDGSSDTYNTLAYMRSWSEATIVNSIFDNGSTQLWIEGANVRVFDCDFVSTPVTFSNGGPPVTNYTQAAIYSNFMSSGGSATLTNSILSGATTAILTFNNTTVNISGASNIYQNIGTPYAGSAVNAGGVNYSNADPKFITPSSGPNTGNFQLQNTSPALFQGINYSFITNDYLGNPRPAIIGKNPDIGAFEDQTKVPPAASVPYSLWPLFE